MHVEHVWGKWHRKIIRLARELAGDALLRRAGEDGLYTLVGTCWYAGLWYIHDYPADVGSIGGRQFGNCRFTRTEFYDLIVPVMIAASLVIDEIRWEDRLNVDNHGTGIFAQRYTAFVDCAPIYVQRPTNKDLENALFDGKTGKGHCYKIQIGINFLGWIVMYTRMHISKRPDNRIFDDTADHHPLEDWELWFGDGAYASCAQVDTKHLREDGGTLSRDQLYVNSRVNHFRQRVEHIMGVIKKHNAFRLAWMGGHDLLEVALDLTVQMTNVALRKNWVCEFGVPRYAGFRYGRHNR